MNQKIPPYCDHVEPNTSKVDLETILADKATLESWQRDSPFMDLVGIEVMEASGGRSRLRLPARVELTNRKGDVQGGAIATLLDFAAGRAVRSGREGLFGMSTVNLNISYLSAARGELQAAGRVVRAGRSLVFADAQVEDLSGVVVATATATFRIFE